MGENTTSVNNLFSKKEDCDEEKQASEEEEEGEEGEEEEEDLSKVFTNLVRIITEGNFLLIATTKKPHRCSNFNTPASISFSKSALFILSLSLSFGIIPDIIARTASSFKEPPSMEGI